MEEMRLQKFLSEQGILSRRAAEEEIKKGKVKVNGVPAELGTKIIPDTDVVEYKGKRVGGAVRKVYIMLNKPVGYVTTMSDEKGRPCVAELVENVGVRVYPIGRLDLESEGLLLFTNDGEFANRMMHPSHQVDKTYLAWVTDCSDEALQRLRQPIVLDGYRIRAPKLRQVKPGMLEITIHEGRNRQVRRMCESAGMHVTRLRRIREGNLSLGDLPVGKWRYLTAEEIASLPIE